MVEFASHFVPTNGAKFAATVQIPPDTRITLSFDECLPDAPDMAGEPAVLVVNLGAGYVDTRMWHSSAGEPPLGLGAAPDHMLHPSEQKVVSVTSAHDQLAFLSMGQAGRVHVVAGRIVRSVDLGSGGRA